MNPSTKNSVLIFAPGYLPGVRYGGPVSSISNFASWFSGRYDIRIVTCNHELGEKKPFSNICAGWNKVGDAWVLYLPESEYSVSNFQRIMKSFPVKMVYLSGVFNHRMNYPAIIAAKKEKLNVVVATRGELCKNALRLKHFKKSVYLAIMKMLGLYNGIFFQSTSDEETRALADVLAIPDSKILCIPNLPSPAGNPALSVKESGQLRILFISRIHRKKNLLEAIQAVGNVTGDICFDIYGPIEDEPYWKECASAIQSCKNGAKIEYRGPLSPSDARDAYSKYHCLLFPTLSENYGHVIAEALRANCIPLLSRGTTPWDDVEGRGGFLFDLHDISQMSDLLQSLIALSANDYLLIKDDLRQYVEEKFDYVELDSAYLSLVEGSD